MSFQLNTDQKRRAEVHVKISWQFVQEQRVGARQWSPVPRKVSLFPSENIDPLHNVADDHLRRNW